MAAPAITHRLAHGVVQRRNPEVVLQLGERLGERLRDGPGAIDRSDGHASDLGRHRARLQEHEPAVVLDGPLHVLGTVEHARHRVRQRDELSQLGAWQLGPVGAREADHVAARVEDVPRPVDRAAHEPLGSTVDGRDDAAVGAAGHRVDAEQHAAMARIDERLDQHGDRCARQAARVPRVEDTSHGGGELVEVRDPDHRLELTGHRGGRGVLEHRRAPSDERAARAVGLLERGTDRGMTLDRAPAVDAACEVDREHDPGKDVEPVGGSVGERRGLAAGACRIQRDRVVADRRRASERAGDGSGWPASFAVSEPNSLTTRPPDSSGSVGPQVCPIPVDDGCNPRALPAVTLV